MKKSRYGILMVALFLAAAISLAVLGPLIVKKRDAGIPTHIQKLKEYAVTSKGLVESEDDIEIGSQISGIISEIRADKGDEVKKGQTLVVFDRAKITARLKMTEAMLSGAQAQLKELESGFRAEDIDMAGSRAKRAESIYEKAKNEYERQKRLYSKNASTFVDLERAEEKMKVAGEELEEARTNLRKLQKGVRQEEIDRAKASVEQALSDLKYHRALLRDYMIVSPFDGVIVERFRDAHETVEEGTPILTLLDPKKLKIRAELEETDVGKVTEGQSVEVYSEAYRDKVFHGKVYKVFPAVKRKSQRTFDPASSFDINTQEIHIRLDDFAGLKSGMSLTVKFLK